MANYADALLDIVEANGVSTIVLIDAGVDSILRGDEHGTGTYEEDLLSVLAVRSLGARVAEKYLMCVGLGTEAGISEYDFLENWNGIQKEQGYLACVGWTQHMRGVREYIAAVNACHPTNTTINTVIAASVEGHFG